jgi:hypothetical protein
MEQPHGRDFTSGPDSGPQGEEELGGTIFIIGGLGGYDEFGPDPEGFAEEGDVFGALSTLAVISGILRARRMAGEGLDTDGGEVREDALGPTDRDELPSMIAATLFYDGIPVGGMVLLRVGSHDEGLPEDTAFTDERPGAETDPS